MTIRRPFLKLPKDCWTCLEYDPECIVFTPQGFKICLFRETTQSRSIHLLLKKRTKAMNGQIHNLTSCSVRSSRSFPDGSSISIDA